jgi:hypothetical protein
MATEISKGKQSVKLYRSVNRGKAMYQLAFYTAGRSIQKNFRDKSKAKRAADQILRGLTLDTEAVDSLVTPNLESLIAARTILAPGYALHVVVEEHAQAVVKLGKISLRKVTTSPQIFSEMIMGSRPHNTPCVPSAKLTIPTL